MRPIYLALSLLLLHMGPAHAQYNFESCHAFWKLTDKLRSGLLPSDTEWSKLKGTEGYGRKNISAGMWKAFRDNVTLVYSPGNEEKVAQQMAGNLPLRWITRYAREEEALKKYVSGIDQLHIMDSAIYYAAGNLPRRYRHRIKPPVIYFLPFDYDANGNSSGINMDLLVSYDMERFRPGIFSGHEMFHYALAYYRIKTGRFRYVAAPHQAVFIAVNGISEEGAADLIDKTDLLFNARSPYLLKDTLYAIYVQQSASCISRINEALEKMAVEEKAPYTGFAFWQSVMPVAGHVPGLYMGRVIRQHGLAKKLIKHISNPFSFFYLYNKAAKADKEKPPLFSPQAISYLKFLEKSYMAR